MNKIQNFQMTSYDSRLATFASCDLSSGFSPFGPTHLARAGIFFNGEGLECSGCHLKMGMCSAGDALDLHERLSQNCPFLRESTSGPDPRTEQVSRYAVSQSQPWHGQTSPPGSGEWPNERPHECMKEENEYVIEGIDSRQHPDPKFMERMKSEEERLKTYWDFQYKHIQRPEELATAGLYYTGMGDTCQCAFCHGRLHKWEHGDIPIEDHRKHYPHCGFVKGKDVGNIPLGLVSGRSYSGRTHQSLLGTHSGIGHQATSQPHTFHAITSAGSRSPSYLPVHQHAHRGHSLLLEKSGSEQQRSQIGSVPLYSERMWSTQHSPTHQLKPAVAKATARFPNLSDYYIRLQTFIRGSWQNDNIMTKERLAEAGFFYTGQRDNTQCYFCGGMLRQWDPLDDPWEEHAFHFPGCGFVAREKGQGFIDDMQQRRGGSEAKQVTKTPHTSISAATGQAPVSSNQVSQGNMQNEPRPTEYSFELKEIKARMDTPSVQMILKKGYPYGPVRKIIEERLKKEGDDFPSLSSLMNVIIKKGIEPEETEETPEPEPTPEPTRSPPGSPPVSNEINLPHSVRVSDPNSYMDSEVARAVINMGLSVELVRKAIENKLQVSGEEYTDPAQLFEAVLEIEERQNRENQPTEEHTQITSIQHTQQTQSSSTSPGEQVNQPAFPSLQQPPSPSEEPGSPSALEARFAQQSLEFERLSQENQSMKEAKVCKICLDREAEIVFLPCGHLVSCPECAPSLKKCPMCRGMITGRVKVFQS